MIRYRLNITDEINKKLLELAVKRSDSRRRLRNIRIVLGGLALLYVVLGLLLNSRAASKDYFLFISAGILIVFPFLLPPLQKMLLRRQQKRMDSMLRSGVIDYSFDENGVHISSSMGESQLNWDAFRSYTVDGDFMYLERRDNHVVLVRLSELPQGDQQALEQLLQTHVPKNA